MQHSPAVRKSRRPHGQRLFLTPHARGHHFRHKYSVIAPLHFVHHAALKPRRRVRQHRRACLARFEVVPVQFVAIDLGGLEKRRCQFLLPFAYDVDRKRVL